MVVVPRRARVAGSIALTTRLDPHESVLELESGARGGTGAEPGSDGVAPISPGGLAGGLLARSTLVCDEVGVEARARQKRSNGIDIQVLVVVGVTLKSEALLVSGFVHVWSRARTR